MITNHFVQVGFVFLNFLFKSIGMLIDNICPSPSSSNPMQTNIHLCPTPIPSSYGQYRQSPPALVNALGGWIVNPSMQTIPQMFHPMFNPHQQYGIQIDRIISYSRKPRELSLHQFCHRSKV